MCQECFLCCRKLNNSKEFGFQESLGKNILKTQLTIIFLVRNLLELSPTSCAEFLSSHGNPSSWIIYCSHCAITIQEAQEIYGHISKLQTKLKSIQQNVEHMLVKPHRKLSKPSDLPNFHICNSIRQEVIRRMNQSEKIIETEYNSELEVSEIKLETDEELQTPFSDDNVDFPNSPETYVENSNESSCFPLEDGQGQRTKIETVDNDDRDSTTCSSCGKKYKYLQSLLNHKTLCQASKNKMTSSLTELQLKQESAQIKIGLCNATSDREKYFPFRKILNSTGEGSVKTTRKRTKRKRKKARKLEICGECSKKYTSVKDLKQHSLRVHFHILGDTSPRNFPCSTCEKSFTTELFKTAHIRVIHKGWAPYRCIFCRKTYTTFSSYQGHVIDSHVKDGQASCDQCESKFCDQETLVLHKRVIHEKNPRPFICRICGKGVISSNSLKTHEANHFKEKAFMCELCSSSFTTGENLESHQRKIHYEELKLEPVICEKCPSKRRFGSEQELIRHLKADHKTAYNFNCSKCKIKRGFMTEEGLQCHMATKHPPGKNFACSFCGKCFRTHRHRYTHIKNFHEATYDHKCNICSKMLKNKTQLNRHIRDVHSEAERVQCPYCPLMFKVSKYLDEHIRQRHSDNGTNSNKVVKDIQCPHCPMMFSDKSYLFNHLKKKHPEEEGHHLNSTSSHKSLTLLSPLLLLQSVQ